jgi:hypothetical protein
MPHMHFLALSISMFHYLELVVYSWHSFPLLYHSIYFPMKKLKKMGEKRMLSHIGSSRISFEKRTNFWVHCHQKFGFNMTLGSWSYYLEFTPLTGYSSSPYGDFIDASYIRKFHHHVYVAWAIHMCYALVQRMSIHMCRPFLRTLEFACQSYPQCVSKSHEDVFLPCILVIITLWVTLNPKVDISSLVANWGVSLVFDDKKSIHTLGFMQCLVCHYPYWWFPRICR